MLAILNQPFPAHTLTGSIRMAAVIGLFVAVFLLIFQPFGMREAPGGTAKILAICGYGVVTFLCISISALIFSRLFPTWFLPASWTVSKEIRITLFNFLLIGFFNTLYSFYIFGQPFSLSYLLYFQFITLAVGILPVSLIVLFRYNRLLTRNLQLAREMNAELPQASAASASGAVSPAEIPVAAASPTAAASAPSAPAIFTFTSETGTEQVTVARQDFLFAAAADNYVELHYLEQGLPKKSLIRSSLSRVEEMVKPAPRVLRCHRAYLVNLDQVRHFSGNAQGLKLELNHTPVLIPVSRNMVPEIKSLLHG